MGLPILLGIAWLVGFLLALALARTWRRTGGLALLGLCLALGSLAFAYFTATPSDQKQDCSDCYVYLGRWWEPGFALFFIGLTFTAWILGVLIGWGARATARRTVNRRDAASRAS